MRRVRVIASAIVTVIARAANTATRTSTSTRAVPGAQPCHPYDPASHGERAGADRGAAVGPTRRAARPGPAPERRPHHAAPLHAPPRHAEPEVRPADRAPRPDQAAAPLAPAPRRARLRRPR